MENSNANNNHEAAKTTSSNKNTFLWLLQILTLLLLIAVAIATAILHINLNNRVYRLHHRVLLQQEELSRMQGSVQNLAQPEIKRARILEQVNYLLRLANLHLNVEGNVPSAIQLLKIADQIVADLNDPSLLTLRHAFANDLAALQAVPKIDSAGIVLKINAMSQQIPDLPVLPVKIVPQVNQTVSKTSTTPSLWKRAIDDIGHALQNVVVIRRTDVKEPLLPPEQQAFLALNMQLKLSQAQWAVLQQQPALYQQSLQQVATWIRQYYVQSAPATESILKALTDLQNTVIKPTLPDISDSTAALENALNNSSKRVTLPAGTS